MKFTALGLTVLDQAEMPNQGTTALTPGSTVAAAMAGQEVLTLTPAQNCQINASGGVDNQVVRLIITTSGVSSFTITFGTNFKSTGTLATGTADAKTFIVQFICRSGVWYEVSRTAAM